MISCISGIFFKISSNCFEETPNNFAIESNSSSGFFEYAHCFCFFNNMLIASKYPSLVGSVRANAAAIIASLSRG